MSKLNAQVWQRLYQFLQEYKKKTVDLSTLQNLFDASVEYPAFAHTVEKLEAAGLLIPVKTRGYNHKTPALAYRYHIGQTALHQDFYRELQRLRLRLHPAIKLDFYYKSGPKGWQQDLPWVEKVDVYLKEYGLPGDLVPAPERSYQIMGDEKWYDESGGKELLERLGLGDKLLGICPAPEPLVWALQPDLWRTGRQQHLHLIVENKTAFHALFGDFHQQQNFTTLIYGRGKAVITGLALFYQQTGLSPSQQHTFHYFGDLDYEGIGIWYSLQQRMPVQLARPFYQALLSKADQPGKDNQRANDEALAQFLPHFSLPEQERLQQMLLRGCYLPQEALSTEEIKTIGRNYPWISD
ncbi:Wadjet anti-phage system protein JetD domain-containing protein [Desulfotomaculum sp. 1211_IL3151]|uniref:Wadjet anti-phage system protein JetD domain-containing protein n=1 Tax=Desulfotomaculum sp. 1211_IL3151 TaxID=3084055 RepID=UPI002FD94A3E